MPVCAKAIQQPDGSLLLALDPATQDLSTCPYLVEDGASNGWRELGNLTMDQAGVIGMQIGAVWAIAYGFKLVRRSLPAWGAEE